uniref:Glycine-rich domain-containing protein n=1 Tax=viral metagenome TaxID=1070528 RepID=A0A6C0IFC4_9ZZZZ
MPAFISNPISSAVQKYNTTVKRGRRYKGFLPSFNPIIYNLSTNNTIPNKYTVVYVSGENFFPNGITYVNFGGFHKIPVVFYSSFLISFLIPLQAIGGNYSVVAVNIYNDNFSPPVNYSYSGHLNYSNSLNYFLLHYKITGSYDISKNSDYNTVITLTADSTIVFYNTYQIYFTAVGGGGGGAGGAYINSTGGGGGGGGGGEVITGYFSVGIYHQYKLTVGIGGNGGTKGSISSLGKDGSSGTPSTISAGIVFKARGGGCGFGDETTVGNGKGGRSGNDTLGGAGNLSPGGFGTNGAGGGGGATNAAGGDTNLLYKTIPYYGRVFGAGGGGGAGAGSDTNGTTDNIYAGSGNTHISGTANYGGGGGGGQGGDSNTPTTDGGKGGSGVIILMFNI